jgi:hypothetical protein
MLTTAAPPTTAASNCLRGGDGDSSGSNEGTRTGTGTGTRRMVQDHKEQGHYCEEGEGPLLAPHLAASETVFCLSFIQYCIEL